MTLRSTRSRVQRVWCRLPYLSLWVMRSRRMGARFARSQRVPCHFKANATLRRILPVEPASDDMRRTLSSSASIRSQLL